MISSHISTRNVCVPEPWATQPVIETSIKTSLMKILLFLSNWKSAIMRKTGKKETARKLFLPIIRTENEQPCCFEQQHLVTQTDRAREKQRVSNRQLTFLSFLHSLQCQFKLICITVVTDIPAVVTLTC